MEPCLLSTKDLLKHKYNSRYVPCYAFVNALSSDIILKCVWLVVKTAVEKLRFVYLSALFQRRYQIPGRFGSIVIKLQIGHVMNRWSSARGFEGFPYDVRKHNMPEDTSSWSKAAGA